MDDAREVGKSTRSGSNFPAARSRSSRPVYVELRRGFCVEMAEQELHFACKYDLLAVLHAVRQQVDGARRLEIHLPPDLGGKESESQHVRRGDGK